MPRRTRLKVLLMQKPQQPSGSRAVALPAEARNLVLPVAVAVADLLLKSRQLVTLNDGLGHV